jgi:hypothetical protein
VVTEVIPDARENAGKWITERQSLEFGDVSEGCVNR